MYVEFPSSPGSDVEDFEETILNFLFRQDPIASTSALAEQLAEEEGEEYNESFRSRVQYNVSKLDEKGYVDRNKEGNRLETQLSTMGRMWVKTH
jgi:repressor of nif and glnA expression